MVEEQLTGMFPLFSTHLGCRALTGCLILCIFKYLRLRNLCSGHRNDSSYIFRNGKNIGFRVRRPGIRFSYILLVLLYTVEMWRAGMGKFLRKSNWEGLCLEGWGTTVDTFLGSLDPERLTLTTTRVPGTVLGLRCLFIKLCWVGSEILITRMAWQSTSQRMWMILGKALQLRELEELPHYAESLNKGTTASESLGHHSISCG